MNMNPTREPPITLVKADVDKLSKLAALRGNSPIAAYLANELDRAHVVETFGPDGRVIRLGSRIVFRDTTKRDPSEITLVMPSEADIGKGRVSIMTPVGAALLGLGKGQAITFTLPKGEDRTLLVLEVDDPG